MMFKKIIITSFILAFLMLISADPQAQIPSTPISGLPNANPNTIKNGDYIPIVRNGVTYKATPWAFPNAGNIMLSSGTGISMTSLAEVDGYCVEGAAGAWSVMPCITGAAITGSPSSGELTTFATGSSVTNGNLSGDVTTSNSTATTIAKIRGTTVSGTTGSGNAVLSTSPTLVTPILGTPTSVNLSNATALPLSTGVTGTLQAAQFPALTGDATTSAGSLATTLATVNSNVGSFTNANITVNGKGLITAASSGGTSASLQSSYKNLISAWASNTTVTITADQLILQNNSNAGFLATSVNCTINSGTSGAGGLDTGTLAASTWYYDYIIYNGSTISCIMSASSSSPTLPGGYTYQTGVISAEYSDGSKHFLGFKQYGRDWQYVVGSNLSTLPSLISGSSGSTTTPTWTAVAVTTAIPTAIAAKIKLVMIASGNAVMAAPNNSYGTVNSTTNTPPLAINPSADGATEMGEFILESTNIYYAASGSGAALFCMGFTLNI